MLSDVELGRLRYAADFSVLPRGLGPALAQGAIRTELSDFHVSEDLPFELSGEGEHLYLHVRKIGQNTRWVAKRMAEALGVAYGAVGFAGMKDRYAVTEQWFSVHLPGLPDPEPPELEGVEILQQVRHNAKLRTGAVARNRFRLVIRELQTDRAKLEQRLAVLPTRGAPNYFGPQRFGRDAANLELLTRPGRLGREARGFGLSALRAALFNGYLAMRVMQHSWDAALDGEASGSQGGGTGLLWGTGQSRSTGRSLELEEAWFSLFPDARQLLESQRVRMMRRSLTLLPTELEWEFGEGRLTISFQLPRGTFATSLLRELGDFRDASARSTDGSSDSSAA